jgi:putative inorganic carbon (HCO3(-)) transporter
MRDYLIFAIVFGLLPYAFKRPAVGAMLFAWISLMNPHRLCYGAAYNFPFAAVIAGVTVLSLLISKEPKRFPARPTTIMLLLFLAWVTFTSFFALEPNLVWIQWNVVAKTMFMVLVSIMALNTERDVKQFAWVVGLSLGFWGLKGGVFTLMSGGANHVYGPPDSFIADNNDLALALVTTLPIIWYLHLQSSKKWLRLALLGVCVLTIVSAAGSYSRGALLGGVMMLFFLWLKSKKKLATGMIVLLLIPLVYYVMPAQWFARMGTIDAYGQDASALGRINAWHFAVNVATHNLLGGGFRVFTPQMFLVYAPDPRDYHVAHSIYFQALGEQGPIGLVIYLILMACAWRTGTRVIKFCKDKNDLRWAGYLASMSQVSIIGFAVGGAFLSLAYFDLYFDIVALLVVLEKVVFTIPRNAADGNTHPGGAA